MLQAFKNAKLGDDVYEEDQEVNELQEYAAKLLRIKRQPYFFQVGLRVISLQCSRIAKEVMKCSLEKIITPMFMRQRSFCSRGCGICPIETSDSGSMNIEDMLNQIKDDDPHYAVTKLLCLRKYYFRSSSASKSSLMSSQMMLIKKILKCIWMVHDYLMRILKLGSQ